MAEDRRHVDPTPSLGRGACACPQRSSSSGCRRSPRRPRPDVQGQRLARASPRRVLQPLVPERLLRRGPSLQERRRALRGAGASAARQQCNTERLRAARSRSASRTPRRATSPSDCCSNSCNGTCVVPTACKPVGEACGSDSNCCTNSCVSGICTEPAGSCLATSRGLQPATPGQCCSGKCTSGNHAAAAAGPGVPAGRRQLHRGCAVLLRRSARSGSAPPTTSAPPRTTPCTRVAECCGLTCTGNSCASGACATVGTGCYAASQCCSGVCTAGTCAAGHDHRLELHDARERLHRSGPSAARPTARAGRCVQAYSCNAARRHLLPEPGLLLGRVLDRDHHARGDSRPLPDAVGRLRPGRDPVHGQLGLLHARVRRSRARASRSVRARRRVPDDRRLLRLRRPRCCGGTNADYGGGNTTYNVTCDKKNASSPATCDSGTGCNPPGQHLRRRRHVNASQNCCCLDANGVPQGGGVLGHSRASPTRAGSCAASAGRSPPRAPTAGTRTAPGAASRRARSASSATSAATRSPACRTRSGVLRCAATNPPAAGTCAPRGATCTGAGEGAGPTAARASPATRSPAPRGRSASRPCPGGAASPSGRAAPAGRSAAPASASRGPSAAGAPTRPERRGVRRRRGLLLRLLRPPGSAGTETRRPPASRRAGAAR